METETQRSILPPQLADWYNFYFGMRHDGVGNRDARTGTTSNVAGRDAEDPTDRARV